MLLISSFSADDATHRESERHFLLATSMLQVLMPSGARKLRKGQRLEFVRILSHFLQIGGRKAKQIVDRESGAGN